MIMTENACEWLIILSERIEEIKFCLTFFVEHVWQYASAN